MRFMHTADWHIGKPFSGVEDSEKRTRLQQERLAAVRRLGEVARRERAEFVLVAGDIFDTATVSKSTVAEALAAIGSIVIPVYAIPGNHDHGGAGSVWEQAFFREEHDRLARNLNLIQESGCVEVPGKAILLACPMARRQQLEDATAWLRTPEVYAPLPAGLPRVVLAHGSVQDFSSAVDPEDIAVTPNRLDLSRLPVGELDYIALGDWHGTREQPPKAWYAGTPELDRFPKGEVHDPGNVLLVEIAGRGAVAGVTRHRVGHLCWHELAFSFGTDASLDQFRHDCDDLLGGRAGEDLLGLRLNGTLSFVQSAAYEAFLESLGARLLRLRIEGEVSFVPSEDELARLEGDPDNPLVASVARRLAEEARAGDEGSRRVAVLALRQLYVAVTAGNDARVP